MSEPAKCPYCGADDKSDPTATRDEFACGTIMWGSLDERSRCCYARQLTALQAENKLLREACEEMHRTLTSPSRTLLESTRKELAPWLPMLTAALAQTKE